MQKVIAVDVVVKEGSYSPSDFGKNLTSGMSFYPIADHADFSVTEICERGIEIAKDLKTIGTFVGTVRAISRYIFGFVARAKAEREVFSDFSLIWAGKQIPITPHITTDSIEEELSGSPDIENHEGRIQAQDLVLPTDDNTRNELRELSNIDGMNARRRKVAALWRRSLSQDQSSQEGIGRTVSAV